VEEDDLRAVLSELLRHAELKIEMGLNACSSLNHCGRYVGL